GICSTTFLEQAFRTDSYRITVTFHADGSWSYVLETMLLVRGRSEPFLHRDENRLIKVGEPVPNPLMRLGRN
ncbi:MAG: FABP family protein, partial [Alphaproteobacteria bacterium]|nr:FABP family protein [Alphaproteobacteria bacterium]